MPAPHNLERVSQGAIFYSRQNLSQGKKALWVCVLFLGGGRGGGLWGGGRWGGGLPSPPLQTPLGCRKETPGQKKYWGSGGAVCFHKKRRGCGAKALERGHNITKEILNRE